MSFRTINAVQSFLIKVSDSTDRDVLPDSVGVVNYDGVVFQTLPIEMYFRTKGEWLCSFHIVSDSTDRDVLPDPT